MSNQRQPPSAPLPPPAPNNDRPRRTTARSVWWRTSPWRWVAIGVAAIVIAIVVALGLVARRADQALQTIQQEDPRLRQTAAPLPTATAVPGTQTPQQAEQAPPAVAATAAPPPNALQAPVNILLIGVDRRPDQTDARTDTLIVVHLDPLQKWASMLSIPRDSVATIPHVGQAKINAAYTFGYKNAEDIYGAGTKPDAAGGALAAETVERFLGVRIDYVSQVDFHGFEQLVNAVGGLMLDVPRPLVDPEYPTEDYGIERIYIPAGLQVLDGKMALVYARSRHASSDFDRSQRQQQVLHALFDQVKARGLLQNAALLPQWADVLAQNVRTTLPVSDLGMLNGLATLARELDSSRIVQTSINPDTVRVDGENGSDIYWNKADIKTLVARWQTGPTGTTAQTNAGGTAAGQTGYAPVHVQVLNGSGQDNAGSNANSVLQNLGFAMIEPAGWNQREHTTVIDYTNQPVARQRIVQALGADARYVQATPGPDAPQQDGSADIIVILGQDYKQK